MTSLPDFHPNAAQQHLAESLALLGFQPTLAQTLQAAGVPARTYYHWMHQDGFARWFAAEVLQLMAASAPLLLVGTLHAAMTADVAARNLIFRLCIQPMFAPAIASRMALPAPGSLPPNPPAVPASIASQPPAPTVPTGKVPPVNAALAESPAPPSRPQPAPAPVTIASAPPSRAPLPRSGWVTSTRPIAAPAG